MITCPNCKALNTEGSQVCGACGMQLTNNQNNEQETQKNIDVELIHSYIGKNSDALLKGGFSWCTFFLGMMYIWYRKMYKVLIAWVIVLVIANAVFGALKLYPIAAIIQFATYIVIAIKFKDLYIKHVTEQVAQIKASNPGKTKEELVEICMKKGGTTIIPVILFIIFDIVLIPLALVLMAIPSVNGYMGAAKQQAFINEAKLAIEVARTDVATNGNAVNGKTYTINELNNLLENKLDRSPYGAKYKKANVKLIVPDDADIEYSICLIDEDHNGFGYTLEKDLKDKIVKTGTVISCE